MSLVKIGPKHQITIPRKFVEKLDFNVGDEVEITIQDGRLVIIPKSLVEQEHVPKLSATEQEILKSARAKIAAINKNIRSSRGLTNDEVEVAAKVGLIDPDQKWWWTEEWQKGEREAEADIRAGNVSKPFESLEELIEDLEH